MICTSWSPSVEGRTRVRPVYEPRACRATFPTNIKNNFPRETSVSCILRLNKNRRPTHDKRCQADANRVNKFPFSKPAVSPLENLGVREHDWAGEVRLDHDVFFVAVELGGNKRLHETEPVDHQPRSVPSRHAHTHTHTRKPWCFECSSRPATQSHPFRLRLAS